MPPPSRTLKHVEVFLFLESKGACILSGLRVLEGFEEGSLVSHASDLLAEAHQVLTAVQSVSSAFTDPGLHRRAVLGIQAHSSLQGPLSQNSGGSTLHSAGPHAQLLDDAIL